MDERVECAIVVAAAETEMDDGAGGNCQMYGSAGVSVSEIEIVGSAGASMSWSVLNEDSETSLGWDDVVS